MKRKIRKLTINILLIYENDIYYRSKVSPKVTNKKTLKGGSIILSLYQHLNLFKLKLSSMLYLTGDPSPEGEGHSHHQTYKHSGSNE